MGMFMTGSLPAGVPGHWPVAQEVAPKRVSAGGLWLIAPAVMYMAAAQLFFFFDWLDKYYPGHWCEIGPTQDGWQVLVSAAESRIVTVWAWFTLLTIVVPPALWLLRRRYMWFIILAVALYLPMCFLVPLDLVAALHAWPNLATGPDRCINDIF
jgi:hypothetical protein